MVRLQRIAATINGGWITFGYWLLRIRLPFTLGARPAKLCFGEALYNIKDTALEFSRVKSKRCS